MDQLRKTQRAKLTTKSETILYEKIEVIDVRKHVAGLKWRWAGHTTINGIKKYIKDLRFWLGNRSR